jgi:F-type H+-transporting ATPase subunit delta
MPKSDAGQAIAFVYASALFDVAVEAGIIAQVEPELMALRDTVRQDLQLRRFLESPTIRFEDKRTVLVEALVGVSKPLLNFLLLIIEHERVGVFGRIADTFHELANAKAGIAEFELRSARALDPEELERLKSVLRRKFQREVVIREQPAPALLGGIVLKQKDLMWDTSLVHRLGRVVQKIEETKSAVPVWVEE